MVSQVTKGIRITVKTNFEGAYIQNSIIYYAFKYQITIENHSEDIVQLMTRHWEIIDALKEKEWVHGEGVVGETPLLHPGEMHQYESGCVLNSSFGAMKGHYQMYNHSQATIFQVHIPTFHLCTPFALN